MTNEQKQVLISGVLGDGCLRENGGMQLSCIHKEYMDYKKVLLGDIASKYGVNVVSNNGYKKSDIYVLRAGTSKGGKRIMKQTIEQLLEEIDDIGIALWGYDDGSKHNKNFFYNLNTHSFSKEVQENVFIPFFNKRNIYPKILKEVKKDGREFHYLYISKWRGAMELSRIMRSIPLNCYAYKLMPKIIEDKYFEIKDTDEWINATTERQKTNIMKRELGCEHSENVFKKYNGDFFEK